jgi:UDP-N-acetylmuramate dehydrogenase
MNLLNNKGLFYRFGAKLIYMIKENISLKDKTWFQTGGFAKFYAEPINASEFCKALEFAKINKLEIFILGAGANILISDEGFNGLVIRPQLKDVKFDKQANGEVLVTAGAGTNFSDLINICFDNNTLGLEEFSGIPGTVGGAVFINLHFFKFILSQFLIHATVIDKENSKTFTVDQNWFDFGYNQSTLQGQNFYLLDATFRLKSATDLEVAYAKGRSHEIIRYRTWSYPSKNTCGSFFRNFSANEVTIKSGDKKMIYVAYYLDKTNIKGSLQVGDAVVSYQHANMIVNQGKATSSDIINLARTMQEKVLEQFGIIPKPECLLIGFKEYPLLKDKVIVKATMTLNKTI